MSDQVLPEGPNWAEMDEQAFQNHAEVYRREVQFHCYRMLGSVHDAEDLVQETFIRALRGRQQFEGRSSLRSWLYRIATNACLNALSRRAIRRRILPDSSDQDSAGNVEAEINNEIPWLQPYPDAALDGIADQAPDPGIRYEMRDTVRLAFMAAIQYLPAKQRAVVLLRDALGWSADETAKALGMSVASANSALQRARTTLTREFPNGLPNKRPAPTEPDRDLLERYVRAWEGADLDGLIALLKRDAVLAMPPFQQWYRGPENIRMVLARAWVGPLTPPFRLIATSANQQPAFGLYSFDRKASEFKAVAIDLIEIQGDAVARIDAFINASLFRRFGLPLAMPASGTPPAAQ
ncbi:MAG: sigma-70 family RNA polymerase sigma factor [Verrucomicrobiota bacterium]|jgi:RNA polymerase sigma-70 factor (ECF subfamily)